MGFLGTKISEFTSCTSTMTRPSRGFQPFQAGVTQLQRHSRTIKKGIDKPRGTIRWDLTLLPPKHMHTLWLFYILSHTLHLAAKFSPNVGESGTENTLKTNTPFSSCLSAFNSIVTCNYVFVAFNIQVVLTRKVLFAAGTLFNLPFQNKKRKNRKHFVCCECAWGDLHFWCSVHPVIQKSVLNALIKKRKKNQLKAGRKKEKKPHLTTFFPPSAQSNKLGRVPFHGSWAYICLETAFAKEKTSVGKLRAPGAMSLSIVSTINSQQPTANQTLYLLFYSIKHRRTFDSCSH